MVYYDHDRIMAAGGRKVSDEIDGELPEGKCSRGSDRHKWGNGGMSVNFILLANGIAINKVFDKGEEIRPPEVVFKDGFCVENAHMTGCRGGMD